MHSLQPGLQLQHCCFASVLMLVFAESLALLASLLCLFALFYYSVLDMFFVLEVKLIVFFFPVGAGEQE